MKGWKDIKKEKPEFSEEVEIMFLGDPNDTCLATYEEETFCMLGRRCGSFGEGFQDIENGLVVLDVTHWRIVKTPAEWKKDLNLGIIDPVGWDAKKFGLESRNSFFEDHITKEEFQNRLSRSNLTSKS